ncbi:MAG: hypothetical protein MHPSP_003600 [Paramarteilia canceri]
MVWECLIPGKRNTIWDGGFYRVVLKFSAKYPLEPPHAKFVPRLLHPNVYPTGTICSNLLTNQGWRPALTIKQLLLAFQNLLDEPNLSSPAQSEAFKLITQNPKEYNLRVKRLAQQYNAPVMPIGLPLDNENAKRNK